MSPKLRKTVLVVHRWTGMTVGLVFLMLAVTAAVIIVRPQLEPLTAAPLFATSHCAARTR